jgi:hypothetical protein
MIPFINDPSITSAFQELFKKCNFLLLVKLKIELFESEYLRAGVVIDRIQNMTSVNQYKNG